MNATPLYMPLLIEALAIAATLFLFCLMLVFTLLVGTCLVWLIMYVIRHMPQKSGLVLPVKEVVSQPLQQRAQQGIDTALLASTNATGGRN